MTKLPCIQQQNRCINFKIGRNSVPNIMEWVRSETHRGEVEHYTYKMNGFKIWWFFGCS